MTKLISYIITSVNIVYITKSFKDTFIKICCHSQFRILNGYEKHVKS